MSNLGEWIEEKAIEKTTKELILNMHKYGLSLEKIADIVKKDISEIEEIINNSIVSLHWLYNKERQLYYVQFRWRHWRKNRRKSY